MIHLDNVEHDVAGYLNVLDHVLEDRVVTTEEAESLFDAAATWGLKPEEVVEAHRLYLRRLAAAALADGVLSETELCDLRLVNNLFGFDEHFLKTAIKEAKASRPVQNSEDESLAGKTVCFTGECAATLRGELISRELAHELAARAGLSVKDNVSKKLDLLVVADPYTQSGKAKKARECGIRILQEAVFWKMIGVKVD